MQLSYQKTSDLQIAFFASMFLLSFIRASLGDCPEFLLDPFDTVGGQAGTPIELTISVPIEGKDDSKGTLILPDNWIQESTANSPSKDGLNSIAFRIQTPPDCASGCYGIRLAYPGRVSNSRNVWITKEPWQVVPPTNIRIEEALLVENGIVYSGHLEPRKEIYFYANLPANSRWELAGKALGIDSRASLLWEVRSPQGQSVETSNRGADREPTFQFESVEAGRYIFKLSDQLYRGGADYAFAFQLKSVPLPSSSNDTDPVRSSQVLGELQRLTEIDPIRSSDPSTLLAPRIDVDMDFSIHDESQYPGQMAMPISLPSISKGQIIKGQFDNNRDTDAFDIELNAGQSIAIDLISNLIEQSTDIKLSVFYVSSQGDGDTSGSSVRTKVLDADDQASIGSPDLKLNSRDPSVIFTAKDKGKYQIVLYDQQRSPKDVFKEGGRNRNSKSYFLMVRVPKPDFKLLAYFASPALKPEKSLPVSPTLVSRQVAYLNIIAVRHDGFSMPIRVEIAELPSALSCDPIVISENATNGRMAIYANGTSDASRLDSLKILGTNLVSERAIGSKDELHEPKLEIRDHLKSKNELAEIRHVAYAAEINHGPIPTRPFPTSKLVSSLMIATNSTSTFPLAMRIGDTKLHNAETIISQTTIQVPCSQESQEQTRKIKVPIKLIREPGFQEAVSVHGFQLPSGVSLSELVIGGDMTSGEIEMTIQNVSKTLPFALMVVGETKRVPSMISRKRPSRDPAISDSAIRLWSMPAFVECQVK